MRTTSRPRRRSVRHTRAATQRSSGVSLEALLGHALDPDLVKELLGHYTHLSAGFLLRDWEKVLNRGGKMAESVMKIVRSVRTGHAPSHISMDQEIRDAESDGKVIAEMRTLIPRHARVLYDHRSKRGGGHASFEPIEMDATVVVSVANWILAELLRLYGGQAPDAAHRMATRIVRRPLPLVEEIDGDLIVLAQGIPIREELGFLLLSRYPGRISRHELKGSLRGASDEGFRGALFQMRNDRHIHENDDGFKLTLSGVGWAEQRLHSRLASSSAAPSTP